MQINHTPLANLAFFTAATDSLIDPIWFTFYKRQVHELSSKTYPIVFNTGLDKIVINNLKQQNRKYRYPL